MLTFTWKSGEAQKEGIARFRSGVGTPPKGATLLGRWTRTDFGGGFDLIESEDPRALAEFALAWSDIMDLAITPVVDDEQLTEALKRARR